jgi:hypothetical protein
MKKQKTKSFECVLCAWVGVYVRESPHFCIGFIPKNLFIAIVFVSNSLLEQSKRVNLTKCDQVFWGT